MDRHEAHAIYRETIALADQGSDPDEGANRLLRSTSSRAALEEALIALEQDITVNRGIELERAREILETALREIPLDQPRLSDASR